ncbi:MAG: hypothetical protein DWQ36_10710 [Acidobacteria bacterium]|nr:MAG: hypothetical protein DWQ30_12695 [Acidobacteriota bacterium]REK07683.1 MAG: hypothetical protein DWQ36_10710 [Acidobacteriota bacterium]
MLREFAHWLDSTAWSTSIHESLYAYPLIESTHVWGLAVFVGFAILLDLRLLGVAFTSIPVSDLARRLLPWTIAGFVVMVVSGVLLFYAIPVRTFHSVWFRGKVIMLILAGINVFVFHSGIWRTVKSWDLAPKPPFKARFAGAASLVLWSLIIIFGRMIAYNWFDCDRQPQSAFINWAAGCVIENGQEIQEVLPPGGIVEPPSYGDSPQVVDPPVYDDSPRVVEPPVYDDSPRIVEPPVYEDSPPLPEEGSDGDGGPGADPGEGNEP